MYERLRAGIGWGGEEDRENNYAVYAVDCVIEWCESIVCTIEID